MTTRLLPLKLSRITGYPWLLLAIILGEGFVTIAVEIIAIRQLIPYVGNNVIVTSLIIGIFLLFLAFGYRKGGQYKREYQHVLCRNFIIAVGLLGIGLSNVFIHLFHQVFVHFVSSHLLGFLLTYLFVILAPLVYVLGQTLPITTNLFTQKAGVAAISGYALYVSTLGSFLGAVLTSIVLFNWLGVGVTLFINVVILALLVLLLANKQNTSSLLLVGLTSLVIISFLLNVLFIKHLYLTTNQYNDYALLKDYQLSKRRGKALVINQSLSSFIDQDKKAAPYIETIKTILFKQLKLTNQEILVIGAGGFTLSAESTYGNRFTYVDIDKAIESIVKKHYLSEIKGTFVASDARDYIQKTSKRYDIVIADAYSNYHYIPPHLLTHEYLVQLQKILTTQGLAVLNIIANPLFKDKFSRVTDNTITSVFPHCMKIPVNYSQERANIIYICPNEKQKMNKKIYTDDRNSVTWDLFFRQGE